MNKFERWINRANPIGITEGAKRQNEIITPYDYIELVNHLLWNMGIVSGLHPKEPYKEGKEVAYYFFIKEKSVPKGEEDMIEVYASKDKPVRFRLRTKGAYYTREIGDMTLEKTNKVFKSYEGENANFIMSVTDENTLRVGLSSSLHDRGKKVTIDGEELNIVGIEFRPDKNEKFMSGTVELLAKA